MTPPLADRFGTAKPVISISRDCRAGPATTGSSVGHTWST
jgi:hypothetical protein